MDSVPRQTAYTYKIICWQQFTFLFPIQNIIYLVPGWNNLTYHFCGAKKDLYQLKSPCSLYNNSNAVL